MKEASRFGIAMFLCVLLVNLTLAQTVNLSEINVTGEPLNENGSILVEDAPVAVVEESTINETLTPDLIETISGTPIQSDNTSNELVVEELGEPETVVVEDGSTLKKIDNKTLEIDTIDSHFEIVSTSNRFDVGDISQTKEWGYHEAGHDIVTSDKELEILNGRYICVKENTEETTLGEGITLSYKSNPSCIYYPPKLQGNFDEEGNFENLVQVTQQDANTIRVDYPFDKYDPGLVNYTGGCNTTATITTPYYTADLDEGVIISFIYSALDNFDFSAGGSNNLGQVWETAMQQTTGINSNCAILNSNNSEVKLKIYTANASANWTFYSTYIKRQSTSHTGSFRDYFYTFHGGTNSSGFNSSVKLAQVSSFSNVADSRGVFGFNFTQSLTPYILVIAWDETKATGFGYQAGGGTVTSLSVARGDEVTVNSSLTSYLKVLAINTSASGDNRVISVLNAFNNDPLYGDANVSVPNGTTQSFIYDSSGNLVDDETYYFIYNNYNQLFQVKTGGVNGTVLENYYYDENGDRAIKIHFSGSTNETVYYFGDYVTVVNSSGQFNTIEYYHGDKLVAERKNDSTFQYYHPDHLGSTSLITNSTGGRVEETLYEPFGSLYSGGTKSRFEYTGKELDYTNLMYFKSRYYNPLLGLFTQPDTIEQNIFDPQLLNKYLYTRANPYKYTDPDGHKLSYYSESPIKKITMVHGKTISYAQEETVGYKITYSADKRHFRTGYMDTDTYDKMSSKAQKQSETTYSGFSSDRNMKNEYMASYMETASGRSYEPRNGFQIAMQNRWVQSGVGIGAGLAAGFGFGPVGGATEMGLVSQMFGRMDLEEKSAKGEKITNSDIAWLYADTLTSVVGSSVVGKLEGKIINNAIKNEILTDIANNVQSTIAYYSIKDAVKND